MKNKLLLQLAPIFFFVSVMIGSSIRTPMIIDEYCFYRLASNYPVYSTTPSWFFEDRPSLLANSIDWSKVEADQKEMFDIVYNTPIYTHPPLVVALVSPVVKGLNFLADKEIIPHIEEQPGVIGTSKEDVARSKAEVITLILRLISISLSAASLWLIFKTMEHEFKTSVYLFAMPIATGLALMTGTFLFYWDAFMMFFFTLTLYLTEVKPDSKWKYITACCLVNTKMFIGITFLGVLIIKAIKDNWKTSWKMILPVLSIIPFYLATLMITKDPLYLVTHYLNQTPIHSLIYSLRTPIDVLETLVELGFPLLIILTLPIFWFWKKYPEFVLLWLLTAVYVWGGGLAVTHTSTTIYTGAIIFPVVAYELKIVERIKSWAKAKQVKSGSGLA